MSEQIFSNIEPVDTPDTIEETNGNESVKTNANDNVSQPNAVMSNKYTDIKLLAESRYGKSRVFMAESSSGTVVIKALKEKYASDPKSISLLKNEYDITTSLDSRFVRKALAYESIDGLGQCIIFEYISGKTLREHVRLGTINDKQVKNILFEICDALSYIHKNGVVHCDLRPANILITEGCHVKIIDFGMPDTEYDANKEILVKELEFVAPELIKGKEGDARSDIYSVGKIMEFMRSRNILNQFFDAETPCTQYSKEQRYNNILELKSAMSSGSSSSRIILFVIVALLLAVVAFGISKYVDARMKKEEKQREEAIFSMALKEATNAIPELCDKYAIKDMKEPLRPDWAEDSLRMAQKLNALELSSEMKEREINVLSDIGDAIYLSRKNNFERILLTEYGKAQDSVALSLKNSNHNPTAEQINQNAAVWFEKYVKTVEEKE